MHPNPHQRPTFAEVLELLEPVRERAERGELQIVSQPESETAGKRDMGALLGSVNKIEEGDEEGTPKREA